MSNIEEILNGTEQPEIEPEVETEEGTQQAEESTGEEAEPETAEEQQAVEPPSTEDDPNAFRRVTRDEYQRYQEAVRQNQAFQQAMLEERKKRQQAEEQANKVKFWDAEDPDAFLEQKLAERESKIRQEMQTQYLNLSEASAKARHEDYDEKFQVFSQMVQRDPSIYRQMLAQPDPAEYAYRAASRLIQMQEMGNPDEYRKKVAAEVEQKIRAEIEEKMKAEYEQKLQSTSLPGSFSEASSRNVPRGSFAGPTSLDSILG